MAAEKAKIKENIEGIVVGVILIVLGVLTVRSYFVEEDFLANELPYWEESTAVITVAELLDVDYNQTESTHRVRFTYEFYFYNADDEKIEMTRVEQGTGNYSPSEEEKTPRYEIGDRVPISYDPYNYDDYYLETIEDLEKSMSKSYEIPLGLGLGIPGLALTVYNIIRIVKKRSKTLTEN
jgi:hypothetical protein